MLAGAVKKDNRVWFNVHRRELINQSSEAFNAIGLRHGIIAAGFNAELDLKAQINSVQTLARRFQTGGLKLPKLCVWDECSHIAASSWDKIFKAMPEAYHIGLTATPERLDGKGLGQYFDEIVNGPSVSWLIENGFLSPFEYYAPPAINIDVPKDKGDFERRGLESAMNKPKIVGDAIQHYMDVAYGKRCLVFASGIKHSLSLVEGFNAQGIPAKHVDAETPAKERDEAINDLENGKLLVLSNVDLFSEGVDVPAIEVVSLNRPTASLPLHLQQVGRALRTFPGKEKAIILDHAGNYDRHGSPDAPRNWSLLGRKERLKKESQSKIPTPRRCLKCWRIQAPGRSNCRYCGEEFATKPRKVMAADGQLVVVSSGIPVVEAPKPKRTEHQEFLMFMAIGRKRKYPNPERFAIAMMRRRKSA